jgi:hypothetical protein
VLGLPIFPAIRADLSRDIIHALALKHGLDTMSQIAVDEGWSALRLKRRQVLA